MLGIYNYTVILTYFGLLAAFTGITFAVNGDTHSALICLMIAGICDMFDGKVASTKTRSAEEKRFGIQIDSLSDLICFGVLPAIIVYVNAAGSDTAFYISGFYLLCALIRLAYFNVEEEKRQNSTLAGREIYLGLPVTAAALIIPALVGLGRIFNWPLEKVGPLALMATAVAFITPFPLKKPKLPGKVGMIVCGGAEILVLIVGLDL